MSYSFHEVLPYMITKSHRDIGINYVIFENLMSDEKFDELTEAFYEMTNDYEGDTVTFELPAFTGIHIDTKELRSFEAKTFTITMTEVVETLDDCYEGKTFYSYRTELLDEDSKEKMNLFVNYYAATDHDLTDLSINLKKEEKKPAVHGFALIENMWPQGFLMHGVFMSVTNAVKAYEDLKKEGVSLCDDKRLKIEEFPMDCPLFYNPDQVDTALRSCVATYDVTGKLVERFNK